MEAKMEKRKIRLPLSRKIALMVTAFGISLSIVLIVMSYVHYRKQMFAKNEQFAMNIGAVAASQLDPDRIQHYLDTGEPDEDYERAYRILCQIRENGGIKFLYVVKPELDEVWYVLDTDPGEGAIPLGYHEPYYQGAFADNAPKMARGERIDPIVSNEEYGWLMSVYYPMRTSDGKPAGYVGVDIQMNDVMEELNSFAWTMIWTMLCLTLVFLAIMINVSYLTIASPIRKLSAAADQLVHEEQAGELADTSIFSGIKVSSQDEIGELYQSLGQMEKDMNTYIHDLVDVTSENERITAELSLATRIQAAMLPHIFPAFPERKEFDIHAAMTPAKEVGGDFYDFFLIDDDHLCVTIADVSGKGVPAALFMMASKIILASFAKLGQGPAEILTKTNESLCSQNQEEMFVTVWLGILEISTGRMVAANAGHEYPVLKHPGGKYELFKDRHGFVLGGMEGLKFKEYEIQLEPGSKLFLYTDGVPEATNAEKEMFGTERMQEVLNEEPDAGPRRILENVHAAVDRFVGDAEKFDDLTMLCLDYRGPAAVEKPDNELELTATDENLEMVLNFINAHLEAAGCKPRKMQEVDMAVEEAFVNVSHYAYGEDRGSVLVRAAVSGNPAVAEIVLQDRGMPFDPLAKKDPDVTLSAEERQIGGLGIYMVKKLMDQVSYEYRDGQNILTMRKKL